MLSLSIDRKGAALSRRRTRGHSAAHHRSPRRTSISPRHIGVRWTFDLRRPAVASARQLNRLDADFARRLVAPVGLAGLDLVDDVHALGNLAEDGVLTVEPRRRVGRD